LAFFWLPARKYAVSGSTFFWLFGKLEFVVQLKEPYFVGRGYDRADQVGLLSVKQGAKSYRSGDNAHFNMLLVHRRGHDHALRWLLQNFAKRQFVAHFVSLSKYAMTGTADQTAVPVNRLITTVHCPGYF